MDKIEIISTAKKSISDSKFIQKIISDKVYSYWEKYISNNTIEKILLGKSNILNTAYFSSKENKKHIHAVRFNLLDMYLESFQELIENESFKNKVLNLENLFFLSTFSELSLAKYFKINQCIVDFEIPYKTKQNIKKDVDLKITFSSGISIFLEVYMPTLEIEPNRVFDPFEFDTKVSNKIRYKAIDKFSEFDNGLNGKIYLAINEPFLDNQNVKSTIPNISNLQLYAKFLESDRNSYLDGVLVFKDSFDKNTKSTIIGILEK